MAMSSPVVHTAERLFTSDIIHQDKAHGPPVIGGGDGAIPLLTCRVLKSSKMSKNVLKISNEMKISS